MMNIILIVFFTFAVNAALLYIYLKVSHRYQWFDPPNESRKLHNIAKPTSAGIVFLLPILLFWLDYVTILYFNIAAIILLILGGIDDFKVVSVKTRLIIMFTVSVYLLYFLFKDAINVNYFYLFIYLLGLVWWLNLFNFMDGVDGMVVIHAIITTIGYIIAYNLSEHSFYDNSPYMLMFLGSLLSFLFFNFPKSKMFMGDSGSLTVAFILAVFALYGLSEGIFNELLIISFHLVFIVDTTLTLFTRIKFKHKISDAHNLHYFQALIHNGKSHAFSSLLYAFITIINVSIALILEYLHMDIYIKIFILLLEMMILTIFWFKFHNKTKFKQFIK